MAANKKERFVGGFTVTYLPLAVDPAAPRRDFSDHVMPICRPDWSSSKLSQLNFKEGVTNKLLGFYQDGEEKEEDIVLLRLNGKNTEVFINRERELMIVLWLHTKGLNPPVYCQLENGLCYGFAPGRMVKLSELHDPAMGKRVAVALAQLHTLEVPPSLQGCMLDVFFDGYLSKVPTKFSKSKNNDSFQQIFGSLETLKREIKEIKEVLLTLKSPLVFCHNDVLSGNIIYNEKTGTVTFIDFEYGGVNLAAFDVGDYFCEFAGLEGADYSLYPGEEVQKLFIRDYLTEIARLKGQSDSVTEDDVHQFYREANKCALGCHMFWCLWALLQAEYSRIEFDYIEYSGVRYHEYLKRKDEFLAL